METQRGFTLIEFVATIVLVSVVAVSLSSLFRSGGQGVQAGRDDMVAAFFAAQQLAMTRAAGVRLLVGTNRVDIRLDADNNGLFTAAESIAVGDTAYPLNLPAGVVSTAATFDYDRLGRTGGAVLTLSGGGASVTVTVADSGYAF